MNRVYLFVAFILVALISIQPQKVIAEEGFAPVFDESEAEKSSIGDLRQARKKMPAASKVPVPAYPGAKTFKISEIPSASDSFFQQNLIVYLSSTDGVEAVKDFYKNKLSGWKETTAKDGRLLFTKVSDQPWWGGSKPLKGPRVEVIDPTNPEQIKMEFPTRRMAENFSGQKAVAKITFELERSPIVSVDLPKVTSACVQHEIEAKMKLASAKNAKAVAPGIKKLAESTCNRFVVKHCKKDTANRFCQNAARKYQS